MKRTIFYSWQSDSPNATNRSFIQMTIDKAIKNLPDVLPAELAPVIDRDTAGLPGSPEISETIFQKISKCDVFIADVTIITEPDAPRSSPNPNILVETGYASSVVGWENIVLVMNTYFGSPEQLPFDLRGRRVIAYKLDPHATDRTTVRKSLEAQFQRALTQAFEKTIDGSADGLAGPKYSIWWGKWELRSGSKLKSGNLVILEVSSTGFLYELATTNGGHLGNIHGYARITSKNAAYSQIKEGQDVCELHFRRSLIEDKRAITIVESDGCRYHHGVRATFEGTFTRSDDAIFNYGLINEIDLSQLYRLTGKHFERLLICMGSYVDEDDLDGLSCRVISGGVPGLYTIMESILMIGVSGRMWAAYLDNNKVTYFANQKKWQKKLPLTIRDWMKSFPSPKIIYASPVDYICDDHRFSWSE